MFSVRFALIPTTSIRGRLIRNPNYGGPVVGIHGWTWRPQLTTAIKPEFNAALRDSIEKEGIRNPVLVWSFNEGIFLTFGGSRVKAACAVGLDRIPAIINDYTGNYSDCLEVTPDNWTEFFTDTPRSAEFGPDGFDYHYNLERARRHEHDEAGLAWIGGTPAWLDKEFPWISTSTKSSQS